MPFALNNEIFGINNEQALGVAGIYWSKWSNDAVSQALVLQKSRGTTSNIFTTVQLGDILSEIVTNAAYGSGMSVASIIRTSCGGAVSSVGIGSQFQIFAADSVSGAVPVLTATTLNGCSIRGTATNDNAAAAFVGEHQSNSTWSGTVIAANTPAQNLGSISLAAGDWDVWVNVGGAAGATASAAQLGLTTTSGVMPTAPGTTSTVTLPANITSAMGFCVRFALAATTTIHLVAQTGAGSVTFVGSIFARRRR
jgi:hypothetical protein